MTSGTKIVFDTCAAILLLKGKYELSSLGVLGIEKPRRYISVVTRMELLSKPDMKPEEEQAIRDFIAGVTVSPLDEAVERKAIEIRRIAKLKLPDCIVVATAIVLDAVLLTDDKDLLGFSHPGFRVQNIR